MANNGPVHNYLALIVLGKPRPCVSWAYPPHCIVLGGSSRSLGFMLGLVQSMRSLVICAPCRHQCFFISDFFLGTAGVLFAICMLVAVFSGSYAFFCSFTHQGGKIQLGFNGNPVRLSSWCGRQKVCLGHMGVLSHSVCWLPGAALGR